MCRFTFTKLPSIYLLSVLYTCSVVLLFISKSKFDSMCPFLADVPLMSISTDDVDTDCMNLFAEIFGSAENPCATEITYVSLQKEKFPLVLVFNLGSHTHLEHLLVEMSGYDDEWGTNVVEETDGEFESAYTFNDESSNAISEIGDLLHCTFVAKGLMGKTGDNIGICPRKFFNPLVEQLDLTVNVFSESPFEIYVTITPKKSGLNAPEFTEPYFEGIIQLEAGIEMESVEEGADYDADIFPDDLKEPWTLDIQSPNNDKKSDLHPIRKKRASRFVTSRSAPSSPTDGRKGNKYNLTLSQIRMGRRRLKPSNQTMNGTRSLGISRKIKYRGGSTKRRSFASSGNKTLAGDENPAKVRPLVQVLRGHVPRKKEGSQATDKRIRNAVRKKYLRKIVANATNGEGKIDHLVEKSLVQIRRGRPRKRHHEKNETLEKYYRGLKRELTSEENRPKPFEIIKLKRGRPKKKVYFKNGTLRTVRKFSRSVSPVGANHTKFALLKQRQGRRHVSRTRMDKIQMLKMLRNFGNESGYMHKKKPLNVLLRGHVVRKPPKADSEDERKIRTKIRRLKFQKDHGNKTLLMLKRGRIHAKQRKMKPKEVMVPNLAPSPLSNFTRDLNIFDRDA